MSISFPLQGYYRPGKFMPVHMVTSNETQVTLDAAGAVPTHLACGPGKFDATVPWVAAGTLREPRWLDSSGQSHPLDGLRPLADEERLVAVIGETPEMEGLFPGKTMVPVPVDRVELLSPALTWEALDGLVLDAASASRLTENQRSTLLAAGTLIAVHSPRPPDRRWPWVRQGEFWVLRHEVAGPTAAVAPDAYLPVEGDQPGWPAAFRRQVVLIAVVFSILALAVSLWRSRWMIVALVTLCAVTIGVSAWWYHRQSPIIARIAAVCLRDSRLTQCDRWRWETAIRPASSSFTSTLPPRPVFASLKQIDQTGVRLVVQFTGTQSYEFHLTGGASLAWMTREVSPAADLSVNQPSQGVLRDFAQQVYAGPRDRVVGETLVTTTEGGQTPTVLIERRPR